MASVSLADMKGYILSSQIRAGYLNKKPNDAAYSTYETVIKRSFYRPRYPLFDAPFIDLSSHTTVYNNPAPQSTETPAEKKQREEQENQRFWMVVGSILATVGMFTLGWIGKRAKDSFDALKSTEQMMAHFNTLEGTLEGTFVIGDEAEGLFYNKETYRVLFTKALAMDQASFSAEWKYSVAALGLASGGVCLAAGGFAAVPAWIAAGKVVAFTSVLFGAGALGWHWNDQRKLQNTYEQVIEVGNTLLTEIEGRLKSSATEWVAPTALLYPSMNPNYREPT